MWSDIEVVITRRTRNALAHFKWARGFESHSLRHTCFNWSGIEVVITSYTGTVVVPYGARGFESHPLRQYIIRSKK